MSKKIKLICTQCSKVFYRKAYDAKRSKGSLCSRKCMGKSMRGSGNQSWKGGTVKELQLLRGTADYKEWRSNVFERDRFTCKHCEKKGGKLEAHHIFSFAKYKEERYNLDNGITLCKECHNDFHSIYTRFSFTANDFYIWNEED